MIDFPDARATVASKINAQGQIVGAYSENSNTPALDLPPGFLLDNSVFTTIEASDATAPSTIVSDINDHGQLVGAYDLIIHGYLRDEHGEFTLIDVPEVVTETTSFGINTHGQIMGFYLGINAGQWANELRSKSDPEGGQYSFVGQHEG